MAINLVQDPKMSNSQIYRPVHSSMLNYVQTVCLLDHVFRYIWKQRFFTAEHYIVFTKSKLPATPKQQPRNCFRHLQNTNLFLSWQLTKVKAHGTFWWFLKGKPCLLLTTTRWPTLQLSHKSEAAFRFHSRRCIMVPPSGPLVLAYCPMPNRDQG